VRVLLAYQSDLANFDPDTFATQLGLNRRALRRRLAAERATLADLVDEARCRRACDELRRPDRNIKEISERLGYSEPSAFHRAFRRWTGQSPAQYRG
jgi:AraC-like DNA-binding protein